MEDNEFEEVTIISHTDQAASILPQQTAERLMKEIRMEVTQKISQTENVKMGSLQHSEATTLLDKIHPILTQLPDKLQIHLVRFPSSNRDQILVASNYHPYFLDLETVGAQQMGIDSHFIYTDEDSSSDEYEFGNLSDILYWRDQIHIFKQYGPVEVYDLQFNHVKTLSSQFSGINLSSNIQMTPDRLYYLTKDQQLVSFNSENEFILEVDSKIEDFHIDTLTSRIVIVDNSGYIFDNQTEAKKMLGKPSYRSKFRLKQMYSDHFLVAMDSGLTLCQLFWFESKTLQLLDSMQFQMENPSFGVFDTVLSKFSGFRVFLRRSIEFCLFSARGNILLYTFLNKKISRLAHLNQPSIETVLHLAGDTWLAAGKNCTICSIEVHFPDALKL